MDSTSYTRDVKTVAVIGASQDRMKFGNRAVRAFQSHGYDVVPINPNEDEIEGFRTYRSILEVPQAIDVATVYVPPAEAVVVVEDVAKKRIPELWLNPGADTSEVVERARELGLNPIVACNLMALGEIPDVS